MLHFCKFLIKEINKWGEMKSWKLITNFGTNTKNVPNWKNNNHNYYRILLSIVRTFLHWKLCWKIPCALYMEGSWERLLWLIHLQWLILAKLFLKNKNIIFAKNNCEIQMCTILVCALYSIKYNTPIIGKPSFTQCLLRDWLVI
jgi:hypothetical protein